MVLLALTAGVALGVLSALNRRRRRRRPIPVYVVNRHH